MRYYIERLPMTIPMGVQSENNAEAVEFDVSEWLARDGSLSFSVWVTRPGETEAYQADNATLKDGVLSWWPTGADTAIAGEGKVEILAVSANRRMLSGWTATYIRETTTETTTDAPVDQRPWLDQALLASEEAKAAAKSAAASAEQAEGVVKKEVAALTEEMESQVIDLSGKGRNLFDGSAVTYDAEIWPSTGEITPNSNGYSITGYIPVIPGKTVYTSRNGEAMAATFLSRFGPGRTFLGNIQPEAEYIVEDGVTHVVFCLPTYLLEGLQVEYDGVTEHKPYVTLSSLQAIVEEKDANIRADMQAEMGNLSEVYALPVEWLDGMYINTGGVRTEYANSRIAFVQDMKPYVGKTIKVKTYAHGNMAYIITDAGWNTLATATSGNNSTSNAKWEFEVTIPENAGYMQVSYDFTLGDDFEMYEKKTVWGAIATLTPSVDNPLRVIRDDPGLLSCFFNVGCIGDSLASGVSVYKDASGNVVVDSVNRYEYSWGQYLARMTGNKYYNWSAGGMRTDTWLSSGFATECFDGQHLCQAYIIGLAQNDYNHSKAVGTAADIDTADYNNNADTFYGRYAKIIQRIKEVQPKAKIFVVTDPYPPVETAGYNEAIRYMATIFNNVYVMDMQAHWSEAPCAAFLENNKRAGHYNAVGYYTIAKMMMTYIDWIMQRKWEDFREIENIGTDWYYYE